MSLDVCCCPCGSGFFVPGDLDLDLSCSSRSVQNLLDRAGVVRSVVGNSLIAILVLLAPLALLCLRAGLPLVILVPPLAGLLVGALVLFVARCAGVLRRGRRGLVRRICPPFALAVAAARRAGPVRAVDRGRAGRRGQPVRHPFRAAAVRRLVVCFAPPDPAGFARSAKRCGFAVAGRFGAIGPRILVVLGHRLYSTTSPALSPSLRGSKRNFFTNCPRQTSSSSSLSNSGCLPEAAESFTRRKAKSGSLATISRSIAALSGKSISSCFGATN